MAVKRGGLGKGLDTLIPEGKNKVIAKNENNSEKVAQKGEQMLKLSLIEPNREQPRKVFDEAALKELSESIKQFGVIQPLIVQKKGNFYEIIAGERRWRASKMAGLKEVPVIVREYTDKEVLEIALIENIQRENLNPIEEALAYEKLINDFKMKQTELAERLSKSRVAITNSLRLLKLDELSKKLIADGKISAGHARALLGIADEGLRTLTAGEISKGTYSVRDVEEIARLIHTNERFLEQFNEEEKKSLLSWGLFHPDADDTFSISEFEENLDKIKKFTDDEIVKLKLKLKLGSDIVGYDENEKEIYETFSDMIKTVKKTKTEKKVIENSFIYEDLEQKMSLNLGTKVNLKHKGKGKGKIEIEYYSDAELEHIFDLLMSISQN